MEISSCPCMCVLCVRYACGHLCIVHTCCAHTHCARVHVYAYDCTHRVCARAYEWVCIACAGVCIRVEGRRLIPPGPVPTAFEDMLENPLNSTQWMNDPETGPVMLQISRIFQTMNRT